MEDHANVLHRILDVIKQPAPKGEYRSTVLPTMENNPSSTTKGSISNPFKGSSSTSELIRDIPSESIPFTTNHMPQLSELSLSGGTVHTDRLLPQIEDLSVALKNFAPALKRLRLPICSNYTLKVSLDVYETGYSKQC